MIFRFYVVLPFSQRIFEWSFYSFSYRQKTIVCSASVCQMRVSNFLNGFWMRSFVVCMCLLTFFSEDSFVASTRRQSVLASRDASLQKRFCMEKMCSPENRFSDNIFIVERLKRVEFMRWPIVVCIVFEISLSFSVVCCISTKPNGSKTIENWVQCREEHYLNGQSLANKAYNCP